VLRQVSRCRIDVKRPCQLVHHVGRVKARPGRCVRMAARMSRSIHAQTATLGRIVDPENTHPPRRPVLTTPTQPEVRHGTFGMEVDIDDILGTSWRILGIADRAVGPMTEPLRMLFLARDGRARHWIAKSERDLPGRVHSQRRPDGENPPACPVRMNSHRARLDATDGIGLPDHRAG